MPLPDWWDGSTAPLLYVSFGTVLGHMSMAATAYRVTLAAVGELDARVLLTVGRRFGLDHCDAIPHNVHVEPWVNQPDVLAEADVVVCHGGSDKTFGALATSMPLVIAPMFADQFANGAKVAASGAGVTLGSGAAGGRRRAAELGRRQSPGSGDRDCARRDRSYRLAAPIRSQPRWLPPPPSMNS